MTSKDVFGRVVKPGYFVAAATTSYKRAHLRVGMVLGISEKGNVSIRWVERRNTMSGVRYITGNSTLTSASYMIVDKDQVPQMPLAVLDALNTPKPKSPKAQLLLEKELCDFGD